MSQNPMPDALPTVIRTEPRLSLPPHPMDARWTMRVDGEIYGPYTGRELEAFAVEGRIEGRTEVCRPGGEWLPARSDRALAGLFDDGKPPMRAPGPRRDPPSISAGDRSTVVNVTNTISPYPAGFLDMGADKSPGVALLLSLFFVGAGQIYNGDVGRGIFMFVVCIALWFVLLGWIINIWSIIDAYSSARARRTAYRRFNGMVPG